MSNQMVPHENETTTGKACPCAGCSGARKARGGTFNFGWWERNKSKENHSLNAKD